MHLVGRDFPQNDTPKRGDGDREEALADEQQPDRRSGDGDRRRDSDIVDHVRAADSFLELARRWITLIVVIIGFGWTLKSQDSGIHDLQRGLSEQQRSFDDFRQEMRTQVAQANTNALDAGRTTHDLQLRYDQLIKDLDNEKLDNKTRDLKIEKINEWIAGERAKGR